MKETWSVGERIFKRDYKRRMRMFGALVESVALFGAEVWGWNIEERLDRVKRRYLRWILGLDTTTPNYILKEECKIEEIREKALKRAVRCEEKALESKKELVKECIKERERNWGKVQEGERARKRKMRNIAKEGLPKYLEGRMKWEDRSMLTRFRCGNETRAREHWKEEGERGCTLCKKGEEDLKHAVEECEITGGARRIVEVLV
ncbi:uncharacterized protein LOC117239403 [Bombus vosnesenskii]|uniref:Uncharacterized protein LOC117239403 n=1 Tax=Bombus vosnesenskii TaxID=207650 RepID=A0A6J3L688_9HYME|nr:uncharacterized protein LOC117239403 [Bombus vosnesenskii]